MGCVKAGDYNRMDQSLANFQNLCQKLRYANFPVVAAAQGMVLGGGCELLMHCDRVVAALETYIGLVEVGVGVIPAGGGCKEMLRRAHENYFDIYNHNGLINYADIDKITQQYYKAIATAQVSASAVDAINLGYLKITDTIIANSAELLNLAVSTANNLAYCNYLPPSKIKIKVGGARIWANIMAMLENYLAGNFISKHDYFITAKLANIFSGGGIDTGADQAITEQKILDLERGVFLDLLKSELTQARINSLLATGKAVRN
jgi:3-hydroxyacyl-CoA dehydrogenase